MEYQAIVELLAYASGHERRVAITTNDEHHVVGVPTSVDDDPAAIEVFLHPVGDKDTEIAIPLTQIRKVELC